MLVKRRSNPLSADPAAMPVDPVPDHRTRQRRRRSQKTTEMGSAESADGLRTKVPGQLPLLRLRSRSAITLNAMPDSYQVVLRTIESISGQSCRESAMSGPVLYRICRSLKKTPTLLFRFKCEFYAYSEF